ncbi:unnamed protein product [Clonostachys rosea]|uniref:Fe2OG dioxygenase domain-containing protein n=1 Tax=Bionectria ochroleuca TaxID=29856 RepID=A0ABY6TWU6_BIOOC|nr:unnamed protein product [Clonostachys rosea]
MTGQQIPAISLRDFESRKEEIGRQLVDAAEKVGFFSVVDHVLSMEEIETQFGVSENFFALSPEEKAKVPFDVSTSLGYENKAQFRPGTGFDQKESLFVRPGSEWPRDESVPGFAESTANFLAKCSQITDQILFCFGKALNFPDDYFKEAMDVSQPDCVNQLRLLHYPAVENSKGGWRHGSHTDIGALTLVFQRDGQDGLEVMPGRETHVSKAKGDNYFPIPAKTGPIVVNIGDMLMTVAWSDDRFKANFHRVRAKASGFSPARYSIGYFNMGRENFVFQGPNKKYPATTCGDYFHNHVKNQFEKHQGGKVDIVDVKTKLLAGIAVA